MLSRGRCEGRYRAELPRWIASATALDPLREACLLVDSAHELAALRVERSYLGQPGTVI
jgi:hypothetical protein